MQSENFAKKAKQAYKKGKEEYTHNKYTQL
jgi:hypothetical protein